MRIGDLFNLEQMKKDLENEQELEKDKIEFQKYLKGDD